MDLPKNYKSKNDVPNPFDISNIFSKLLFIWVMPLLRKGMKRNLTFDDLYKVRKQDDTQDLANDLESRWKKELLKCKEFGKKPKLLNALFSIHGSFYLKLSIIMLIVECTLKIAQPILLRLFIKSFADANLNRNEQYLYAAGVCLTNFLHTIIIQHVNFQFFSMGMQYRVAITSLMYRKSFRLSQEGQGQTNLGQMINLMGSDAYMFDNVLFFFCFVVIGPIQLLILTYLLWSEIGVSCFAGIGFICLLLPLQYVVGKYSAIFRQEISSRTDERARFMNEIISGILVIKMYAWEKPVLSLISRLRSLEVRALTKLAYLRAAYLGIYSSAMKPIILFTILTYLLTGNQLTADKVFFAVACFSTLQCTLLFTAHGASSAGACLVSLKRIESFLLLKEQTTTDRMKVRDSIPLTEDGESSPSVLIQGVSASWTKTRSTLRNINLDVSGNKLVMVVGPVGSGKSSFLNMLISELPISAGSSIITGTTAYAAQEAWIFSGNIRENILFGRDYEETRYQEVSRVCALEEDFRQLPDGDLSIVGERGVSLSGGQKARVNLARALYQDADIVLLDDPLSAVDARVCQQIFEECVQKYVHGRLRILVTHQLQFLQKADYIVVLREGEIAAQGTFEDLQKLNIDLFSMLGKRKEDVDRKTNNLSLSMTATTDPKAELKKCGPVLQEETMASGSVSFETYWYYLKTSKSPISCILLVLGFVFSQVTISLTEYWLGYWTNQEEARIKGLCKFNGSANSYQHQAENFSTIEWDYFWIFCGLVGTVILSVFVAIIGFYKFSMLIGVKLHDAMISSLIRSPAKFFNDNPSGRIMNRVTKDLYTVDVSLPVMNYDTIQIFLQTVGIVVIVIISNYYILAPTLIVLLVFYTERHFYVNATRDLKRLEALSRSPLITHLVASFQGLATIRSSKSESNQIALFEKYQETNTSAYFMSMASTRWFAVWLEMTTAIYLSLITFSFLVLTTSTKPGDVGLAISSILILAMNLQWGMRQSAEVENCMTSVERILEYASLTPEAPLKSAKPLQENWVKSGEIKFENVFLEYDQNEVLKNLSFTINSREKIGIVGRTGAGKSSIITALFRLTEPKGLIYIDGVCINEIGLHELRKNISIIPQDPVLFSGTVRYNLDPFNQFEDNDLWNVLKEVRLIDAISSLDFEVADAGANLSVGERQLVCLARAILRKNLIVVMDEATANVDIKTDNFIQKTIRSKFSHCTILTIAHRLNSVMDCDRILVLDHGTVKEFDHPHVLLQNEDGFFTSMLNQSGKAEEKNLQNIAMQSFHNRDGLE